jgi:hypothetical protein
MRLPPKAAVLRADDPPGRPVGLGGHDLACLEKGRIGIYPVSKTILTNKGGP